MHYNGRKWGNFKSHIQGVNSQIKGNQGHFLTFLMFSQRFPNVLRKVGLRSLKKTNKNKNKKQNKTKQNKTKQKTKQNKTKQNKTKTKTKKPSSTVSEVTGLGES